MTWIKLDDKAPRHPKIAGLSDRAFRWWIHGLCYASEFLTDGRIPVAFLSNVPRKCYAELCGSGLWIARDGCVEIHDYLGHQTDRATVEHRKTLANERVKRFRNGVTTASRNAPGNANITAPDTDTDTENRYRAQTTAAPSPLIKSPAYVHKRMQSCAFVGSRLEVPNSLHADLRRGHGGPDPEKALQDWYLELNEKAEIENWRIPVDKDIFPWLKALHAQAFPVAPVATGPKPFSVADALAREAERKAAQR